MSRVLVAGIGNMSKSDDGFGPEVARRLNARMLPLGVRVVDYGTHGRRLSFDLLDGWDALVVVDTFPPRTQRPGTVHVLEVGPDDFSGGAFDAFDAHATNPVTVLASVTAVGGTLPRTIVVGCEPATVADGMGLSGPVSAALDAAVERVFDLACDLATDPAVAVS